MAAFAESRPSPADRKCDYSFHVDAAFLSAESAPWCVQLKSISSKGATFAMFDQSDDQFGLKTGKVRRELGILAYSVAPSGTSSSLQAVLPKAHRSGGAEQFAPTRAEESMAYSFQRGHMGSLANLHGVAKADHGGWVELSFAEKQDAQQGVTLSAQPQKVFEAYKRSDGEWAVRYRWPLSCVQAFAIAISVLHNPSTSGLDAMDARPSGTGGVAPPASGGVLMQMAKEATAALSRGGELAATHARLYTPVGGDEFTTGLIDMLTRVGLADGERQEKALSWASKTGISSMQAMYTLLQDAQSAEWEPFLENLAPTKAFHKERIRRHLRRATGNTGNDEPAESSRGESGPSYWAQLGA
jgi:hypothetical protein